MYRVVIVDDEKVERNGIRFLLKQLKEDFIIEEFPNGQAAYDWFCENQADLLLTDVKMPFMDGMELIRRVSALYPSLSMVIFSGFNEFEYARTAMRYHVENYILKPVDPEEFRETILQILRKLRRQQEEQEAKKLPDPLGIGRSTHPEIEALKQYIYKNYGDDISIEMLAEKVYMAPAYLSTLFKKETGQNLSRFIKAVRMEKAKELLEHSHKKIMDVSSEVGYPNVSYFCQSFREYFGISPQKFRNKGEEL